ncbi:MAG: hypothetical protein ACK4J0_01950 [Candidatus Anstonellaceae archaeon]
MKVVYQTNLENKKKITELLESDPYGEQKEGKFKGMSFSRLGYKIKEGGLIDEDKNLLYIIFRGGEEYLPFLENYLKDIATKCDQKTTERIIKKIEEEENSAEQGMGAIFDL